MAGWQLASELRRWNFVRALPRHITFGIHHEDKVWLRKQPGQYARNPTHPAQTTCMVSGHIEIRTIQCEDVALRPEARPASPVTHQPVRRQNHESPARADPAAAWPFMPIDDRLIAVSETDWDTAAVTDRLGVHDLRTVEEVLREKAALQPLA